MSREITQFKFPIGYHNFHKDRLLNYQLNRWHSLGYARFEDMKQAGKEIESLENWYQVMNNLADSALAEKRLMNAAYYYRAAEFFLFKDESKKIDLYNKFVDLFNQAFKDDDFERFQIPYGGAYLNAIKAPCVHTEKKGTIILHGGFDSFIEEFYSWMGYFADKGYDVIGFEGPGQGGVRRKYRLTLDYRLEIPSKAVLDYFSLDDVTWLGISMGGYFCFRAAAFESRIKRVIASGIAYDYLKFTGAFGRFIMNIFFNHFRDFTNRVTLKKMETDMLHAWSLGQLMYITDTETPLDAFDTVKQLNSENLHSEMVRQDVLILTGREDHFIPFKMHKMQVDALTNAKSVTARVFTKDDHAQNHCQIGNVGLALDVMYEWIVNKTSNG